MPSPFRRIPIVAVAVALGLVLTAGAGIVALGAGAGTQRVVAIGDSIMDGHGLTERQSWPEVLGRDRSWDLTDLAADGDGFVQKGNDGATVADQVRDAIRLRPSIVLLAGSSNDVGQPEAKVAAAIAEAMQTLRAALPSVEIVAVSPVWNETTWPPQLRQIAKAVREQVEEVGGTVLSFPDPLRGHPEYMQSDDVHPTAAGQLAIATAVEQRWDAEGLD
ncbi:SGNH/GDSL hydrolase family protein [Pseudolysinimonas sp.]|uniref:SGNH/GDSL hydrolase family protein n=1 Tax=Pseudolysinimonas sp. TaxID=2680009 RepID=UPI003F81C25A